MSLIFWVLCFKPAFSLSSFILIKRLFSSSSLSAIIVISSAYLRLLIFLLAILIPARDSSSLAFHTMYSAYELNKQSDSIQPCTYSFPNFEPVRRQVRWSGIPISLRSFQFVVIHTVKGFSRANKAEVDVFLELHCFLHDPTDVGNLISGSSASLYIWKFSVHVLLNPSLGFWA